VKKENEMSNLKLPQQECNVRFYYNQWFVRTLVPHAWLAKTCQKKSPHLCKYQFLLLKEAIGCLSVNQINSIPKSLCTHALKVQCLAWRLIQEVWQKRRYALVLGGYLIFQYQLVVGVSKILFQKV
jgi:hypothetical protein